MASPQVRVNEGSYRLLREMAAKSGDSMQSILERALEAYRRETIIRETNAAYGAMKADPQAWADEIHEREGWESTLMDGIEK